MPTRSSKKQPRDLNRLAASIVSAAIGEIAPEPESTKNVHAQELGRLGGMKGGKARAEKLTPAQRKEIAQKAAKARWKVANP